MHRPIYACDRCGHWFTLSKLFEHNELPYEPGAVSGITSARWDLCAACHKSFVAMLQACHHTCVPSPTERYERAKAEWFEAGKGAEVKPLRQPVVVEPGPVREK